MQRDPFQESIEAGERLGGVFRPEGVGEWTPGVINWQPDRGASLELIQPVGQAGGSVGALGALNFAPDYAGGFSAAFLTQS